jgi:hypothetical protein
LKTSPKVPYPCLYYQDARLLRASWPRGWCLRITSTESSSMLLQGLRAGSWIGELWKSVSAVVSDEQMVTYFSPSWRVLGTRSKGKESHHLVTGITTHALRLSASALLVQDEGNLHGSCHHFSCEPRCPDRSAPARTWPLHTCSHMAIGLLDQGRSEFDQHPVALLHCR